MGHCCLYVAGDDVGVTFGTWCEIVVADRFYRALVCPTQEWVNQRGQQTKRKQCHTGKTTARYVPGPRQQSNPKTKTGEREALRRRLIYAAQLRTGISSRVGYCASGPGCWPDW